MTCFTNPFRLMPIQLDGRWATNFFNSKDVAIERRMQGAFEVLLKIDAIRSYAAAE